MEWKIMASELLKLTTQLVMAHVSANELTSEGLIEEIKQVFKTLADLDSGETRVPEDSQPQEEIGQTQVSPPAVPVKQSIKADYIVCLECGVKLKTLKAHLRKAHALTPKDYYQKFGLDSKTYPLACKNYSEQRRQLAKKTGLGDFRKKKPTA
jgi:predicted transcriptional regulator